MTAVPAAVGTLGFGQSMTERMVVCRYDAGTGWGRAEVVPYGPFTLDPCTLALHYGQAIYEGMKAFRGAGGAVALFRPERNAARFRASAARMAMAEMPEATFIGAAAALVEAERDRVPEGADAALYLRPVMIGDEAAFGVRRSATYLFFIVATPVDSLYRAGGRPLRLVVAQDHARAAPGGGGAAKTAGNYGRTLLPLGAARAAGFDTVLWLDPVRRELIEEAGITNVFVRTGDVVTTPPLNGQILEGVTRETVIQVLRDWGVEVREEEIPIDALLGGIDTGAVTEVFLTGTATHVAPVGSITRHGVEHRVPGAALDGSLMRRVSAAIQDVQRGRAPDRWGWMWPVGTAGARPGLGRTAAD